MKHVYSATVTKRPGGLAVEGKSRQFALTIDEPVEAHGEDLGMTPVELLLNALGACQSIVVAAFAKKQNFTYESFQIEIEGDLDSDGIRHRNGKRPGFEEIRCKFCFKTSEPPEKVAALVKFVEETCPVGDTLTHGVPVRCEGVIVP